MAMAQAGAAAAAATGLLVFLLYSAIHRVEEGHLAVYYRYGSLCLHPWPQGLCCPHLPSRFPPLLFLLPSTRGESRPPWPRFSCLSFLPALFTNCISEPTGAQLWVCPALSHPCQQEPSPLSQTVPRPELPLSRCFGMLSLPFPLSTVGCFPLITGMLSSRAWGDFPFVLWARGCAETQDFSMVTRGLFREEKCVLAALCSVAMLGGFCKSCLLQEPMASQQAKIRCSQPFRWGIAGGFRALMQFSVIPGSLNRPCFALKAGPC